MTIPLEDVLAVQWKGRKVGYSASDTIMYAISIGLGADGIDEETLSYIYEGRPMKTVPSMATVLMNIPVVESGLDMKRLLHSEQRLVLHRPLLPADTLIVDSGVAAVLDKGKEKGAVVAFESRASDLNNRPVFTATAVMLARGDGGIGNAGTLESAPISMPARIPDHVLRADTRHDQAFLYRLNDDPNPLHVDPDVARKAGFPKPILHGLCSYGIACQTIARSVLKSETRFIKEFSCRFTGVVFPGESLEVDVWESGEDAWFRCRVPERNVIVLDQGRCITSQIN